MGGRTMKESSDFTGMDPSRLTVQGGAWFPERFPQIILGSAGFPGELARVNEDTFKERSWKYLM